MLLASKIGEVRIGDAIDRLADQLNLTPEVRAQPLPSGKQTLLGNRIHWAKTYLTKSGLRESTRRGHFKLTERGLQVIASHPSRIDNEFLNQFTEFRQFKEKSANESAQGSQLIEPPLASRAETPDEVMRAAHKQVEISLGQDLLDRIRSAPPAFFERLIVTLVLGMGYGGSAADAGRAIGRSGDDGVDGVIDQDALGLDRVYIQAKRYAAGNSIGAGPIRDFFGSLDRHKATKGLFVTTSTFSPSAKETTGFLSNRIVLIDGENLAKLMIRYNVGCRIEEVLHIKKIDEDFFE